MWSGALAVGTGCRDAFVLVVIVILAVHVQRLLASDKDKSDAIIQEISYLVSFKVLII
jgi:hypothetical protein